MSATSVLFQLQYVGHWRTIERVHGYGADALVIAFQNYAANLARQQNNTYTLPFEVVSPNMGTPVISTCRNFFSIKRRFNQYITRQINICLTVFGMDVLSTEQIIGQEIKSGGLEKVVLPDTSRYIEEAPAGIVLNKEKLASTNAIFPKYNNYVKNPVLFDRTSKFFTPLSLLGIRLPSAELTVDRSSSETQRSVVSYAIYRTAGDILPQVFEPNLKQRYGVDLTLPSTMMSLAALSADGSVVTDQTDGPGVKYRIRVDYVNQRANPQCVHWKAGSASWSREGCRTDFHDPWFYDQEDFHVNCTCSSLGPVAVVMNKEEFMVCIKFTNNSPPLKKNRNILLFSFLTVFDGANAGRRCGHLYRSGGQRGILDGGVHLSQFDPRPAADQFQFDPPQFRRLPPLGSVALLAGAETAGNHPAPRGQYHPRAKLPCPPRSNEFRLSTVCL